MEKLNKKVACRICDVSGALNEARRLYCAGERDLALLCGKDGDEILVVISDTRMSRGDIITTLREYGNVKDRIFYVVGDEKATNYSTREKAIKRIDFSLNGKTIAVSA